MKIRLTLFVGICLLGMVVVVIGCSPGPTEEEKQVLDWLRENDCNVEKLEKGDYQISWFNYLDMPVRRTWDPRHGNYDRLNSIKQERREDIRRIKEYEANMQKAGPVLDWLTNNGCNVEKQWTKKYEISWRIEYSEPPYVIHRPDGSTVVEWGSAAAYNEREFWDPYSNSYNELVQIKEKFRKDKDEGRVPVQ